MAPEATGVALNTVEVSLAPGILALNRFTMTLQNKRIPVAHMRVESGPAATLISVGLDCPEETAQRYAVLLENMEDVEELRFADPGQGIQRGHISYSGRRFCPTENSATGEVGPGTVFSYEQDGDVVSATYRGGDVRFGSLVATADAEGNLDARYQHVNTSGELMTGECRTRPEVLPDGRMRLHEEWRWTSGDRSSGRSVVEEIGE